MEKTVEASKFLEKLTGKKCGVATHIKAYRIREGLKQKELAKILGITKSHISDIENGRKLVSIKRASQFARVLKEPEKLWVTLAIRDAVEKAGLEYTIKVS